MKWMGRVKIFLEGIFTREERMALMFLIGIGVAGMGLWLWRGSTPPSQAHSSAVLFIRVNRATAAELISLPGIGPVAAERIVNDRRLHGPYVTLTDLSRVKGMNQKLLEKIKGYVRFD